MQAARVLAMFVCCASLPVAASAQTGRTAAVERLLAAAERDAIAGRTARASATLLRAHRADPSDSRSVLRLAELLLPVSLDAGRGTADHGRAARTVGAALERYLATPLPDPPDTRARRLAERWAQYAIALGGDHRAAIESLARAAGREDPESALWLRRAALVALLREDRESAERALIAARQALPQDPEVLADLAALWLDDGRASEAAALYEAVVQRRPGDLEALRDLAGARALAGDAAAAVRVLEVVVRQLPERADVRTDLARVQLESGDRAAIESARRALELDREDPEPAILLGQALAAEERRDEARAAFEEALRRRPGHPRAQLALEALAP